jgi:hypothetical protein
MENFAKDIADIYEYTMTISDLYQRDIESTLEALQYCIQGVEDNNRINDGKWSDWTAEDIMQTYLEDAIDIPAQAVEKKLTKFREHPELREALQALIAYMGKRYQHTESGDIANVEDWLNDYQSMDVESWFGKEEKDCKGLHWLEDQKHLVAL